MERDVFCFLAVNDVRSCFPQVVQGMIQRTGLCSSPSLVNQVKAIGRLAMWDILGCCWEELCVKDERSQVVFNKKMSKKLVWLSHQTIAPVRHKYHFLLASCTILHVTHPQRRDSCSSQYPLSLLFHFYSRLLVVTLPRYIMIQYYSFAP